MVGVNMVLAEFAKFKHGLYKSCGIECSEGSYARTMFTPTVFSRRRTRGRAASSVQGISQARMFFLLFRSQVFHKPGISQARNFTSLA